MSTEKQDLTPTVITGGSKSTNMTTMNAATSNHVEDLTQVIALTSI